jgi:hypothetical protein
MNQIIEQSIKEVGQIKLTILSSRKVRLDYTINIICNEIVIDTLKLKIRYLLDKDGIYKMYYPKSPFLVKLSNQYRVKIKFIHYGTIWNPLYGNPLLTTDSSFELYDLKFNNFIKSIYISDENWFKTWNRDKLINNLLK